MVCPARNEADELEAAMRSRLSDPSPQLEFILVDDRSTDATGSIMDALAREDDRVRVVHNEDLPEGWLGKVHAQQRGLELAHGDWILFSDSDVHLRPGLMSSAMAWARDQESDHVALIPRIDGGPFIMRACLSIMILVLTAGTRLWKANDDSADRAMGVGAFNLVRRSTLEAAGGLERIRMEIADDVGIGTIVRESGGRSRLALATDRLSVKWYRSTRDFLQGMEKGAAKAGGRFGLALRAVLLFFTTLVLLAPFVVLAFWAVRPTSSGGGGVCGVRDRVHHVDRGGASVRTSLAVVVAASPGTGPHPLRRTAFDVVWPSCAAAFAGAAINSVWNPPRRVSRFGSECTRRINMIRPALHRHP